MKRTIENTQEALRLRRKICQRIAKKLLAVHEIRNSLLDQGKVEDIIDAELPFDMLAVEAEMEEFDASMKRRGTQKDKGPSPIVRLREALGLTKDVGLIQVIECAIERVSPPWLNSKKDGE